MILKKIIYLQFRKDDFTSDYLFNNLDTSTLNAIGKVINNGLLKNECGFNDCLLLLSKKINNSQFNKTLENSTKDCLSKETKNVEKYNFFKNNLLHSNVRALKVEGNESEKKTQDTDDEDELLLFDLINNRVVSDELLIQKQYIKEEMSKIEKEFKHEFKQLKYSIKYYNLANVDGIAQNKLISKFGSGDLMSAQSSKGDNTGGGGLNSVLKSDYTLNELPFDNTNGFDGKIEYDSNGYLTK